MRRIAASTSLLAVLLGASGLAASAAPVSSAPLAPAGGLRLAHNVLRGLDGLPSSEASPNQVMTVDLSLATADPVGLDAAYRSMYDPRSPSFHHFLTAAEIGDRFGQPAPVYNGAVAWLRGGGLDVFHTVSMRDFIGATGTVAQVDRLFQVDIRHYHTSRGDFLANAAAPTVPANFAISTVIGLNDLQRFQLPAQHPARFNQDVCKQGVCIGTITPADLWSVYEHPAQPSGKGQSVAIIGEGTTADTIKSLVGFEDAFKLPHVPVGVTCAEAKVSGDCGSDSGGTGEWELDTQSSSSMAPEIDRLQLYFSHGLVDGSIINAFAAWLNDPNGPLQANASFSECEEDPANPQLSNPIFDPINVDKNPGASAGYQLGNNLEPALEPMLKKGALQGRTLFAAAGDTAGGCAAFVVPVLGAGNGITPQPVLMAPYPAAGAYTTGVGGTVLYTDGGSPAQRVQEYVWTHSGGGPSQFITAPPYQQGTPNQPFVCVSTPDGTNANTGQLCRGVPDVAALSGDISGVFGGNGYAWYDSGSMGSNGGTSLASPLWAGMYARLQSAVGGRNGLANEFIYKEGKSAERYPKAFFDITLGANTDFPAQASWDYASGWGVPRLKALIADAVNDNNTSLAPAVVPNPASAAANSGLPGTSASPTVPARGLGLLCLLAGLIGLGALTVTRPAR